MESRSTQIKKNSLQDLCKSFYEEFVKLMEEVEKKVDLKAVLKGNTIKRKSKEKRREIDNLNKAVAIMEQKKQKLD